MPARSPVGTPAAFGLLLPLLMASFLAASSAAEPAAGRTDEEAALLAAPTPDLITVEFLAPAARQALANGIATLIARITAGGNDHGLAFPPTQTMKVVKVEEVKVPARRVRGQREEPIYEHEYAEVEKVVPVLESGQPTGRFTKAKERVVVKSRLVGTRMVDFEELTPDPDGSEVITLHDHKYGPGGPAAWAANLPGLNGMALFILAKAGLGRHPATVKHAKALAAHASSGFMGLPDSTFDLAWMTAGFAALGRDSGHEKLVQRLLGKLLDGQIREKGPLDGLWGPVCVHYGYYGTLFMLGQTLRQELDIHIPKKLEAANAAQREQVLALAKEIKALANAYERTHRDVFRCGTQMLDIRSAHAVGEVAILPGLPLNAYQWIVTDVESTEAATFALAEAKRAGLLPRETERLAIRGKKIHPPVKPEVAFKAAAKRLADAIDPAGGCPALALLAVNKGFEKTAFPAPAFAEAQALPPLFNLQTGCTCVAADSALESLAALAPKLAKQLDGPRRLSRDRAAKIAARWYAESADPAADSWKGLYHSLTVSHADLKTSPVLPVTQPGTAIDSLPWGPAGSLYRIVPGFRGLFAGIDPAQDRFGDDLFRQITYRLVALQDANGQWSSPGQALLSTASESLTINRVADAWHKTLARDPPGDIGVADPIPYEAMLHPEALGWVSHQAARPDAAVFPTLASLVFLVEGVHGPVSLDGIAILPDEGPEPTPGTDPGQPPPRLTPPDAAGRVARPNIPREELYAAIIATRWPRASAARPERADAAAQPAPEAEKDDKDADVGRFEDLLAPSPGQE
jgi:hypothetical protein